MLKKRIMNKGEEFNLENGYVISDGDRLESIMEKMAEVLDRLGIDVIDIDAGWSDGVIKFEKK